MLELIVLASAVVCLSGIYAAWDIARRRAEALRFNQPLIDRVADLEREAEKLHDTSQQILSRLSATVANQNRVSRMGRA